jgi:hypothetical protein
MNGKNYECYNSQLKMLIKEVESILEKDISLDEWEKL